MTSLLPITSRRNRHQRSGSERFKCFAYDDLIKRDKVNLDISGSLTNPSKTPQSSRPAVIAAEIVEDLEAALAQFAEIAADLKQESGP
jgi:type I restriction enzyme M protein